MRVSPARRRTFIVGFDFGTHSTKTIIRERDQPSGRIVGIDTPAEGYVPFVTPSLVRIVDDRLHFGSGALVADGGTVLRSLKVRLIGASLGPQDRDVESELLIASFMAWCFQRLFDIVEELRDANVILNISAPTTDLGELRLVERYLRVCNAAWSVCFGPAKMRVNNGVCMSELHRVIRDLLNAPVPGREDRSFFVLAETIAPIVSLRADPYMAGGMYMIADIGASTTETSVFYVDEENPTAEVLCYRDETQMIGGNDLDQSRLMRGKAATDAIDDLQFRLRKQINQVWAVGYQKDGLNRRARQRWLNSGQPHLKSFLSGCLRDANRSIQHVFVSVEPIPAKCPV